ncbi:hypothetical protein [Candidatus Villigracilis vicinus]
MDIYLTDDGANLRGAIPQLLERLKTSSVIAISYHYRAAPVRK